MSTLRDDNTDLGFVVCAYGHVLDLSHDQEAVDDPAEDDVLPVQELALGASHEKLTAV